MALKGRPQPERWRMTWEERKAEFRAVPKEDIQHWKLEVAAGLVEYWPENATSRKFDPIALEVAEAIIDFRARNPLPSRATANPSLLRRLFS